MAQFKSPWAKNCLVSNNKSDSLYTALNRRDVTMLVFPSALSPLLLTLPSCKSSQLLIFDAFTALFQWLGLLCQYRNSINLAAFRLTSPGLITSLSFPTLLHYTPLNTAARVVLMKIRSRDSSTQNTTVASMPLESKQKLQSYEISPLPLPNPPFSLTSYPLPHFPSDNLASFLGLELCTNTPTSKLLHFSSLFLTLPSLR